MIIVYIIELASDCNLRAIWVKIRITLLTIGRYIILDVVTIICKHYFSLNDYIIIYESVDPYKSFSILTKLIWYSITRSSF